MSINHDFRAAAGLNRWPSDLEDLAAEPAALRRAARAFSRSPGPTARPPSRTSAVSPGPSGPRARALVLAATILLGLLAAGLFVVTLNAQYKYVFAVKQQSVPTVIEAASLDLGMAIFTLLALGLAMAGQSARIERALIVACALGSAAQNYAAADVTSPRSVAAYVAPSLFLALVVDRVVAVVRRHVLGDAERSVWATVGRALAALARASAWSCCTCCGSSWPRRRPARACAGSCSTPPRSRPPRRAGAPGRRGGPGDRAAAGDRAARAGGREQEGPARLVVPAGSRLREPGRGRRGG